MYVMEIPPVGEISGRTPPLLNLMRSLTPFNGPIKERWERIALTAGAELDWSNQRLMFDDDAYLLFVIRWS